MFGILLNIGIIFAILFIVGNLWVRFIHPMLFKDQIDDKLEDAVEKKILNDADKKAAEILNDEEEEV